MRRAVIGLICLVAVAVAVVVLAERGGNERSAHGPVTITVDSRHPGRAVPRSFLGLSTEYDSVLPYFGTAARPNDAFLGLVAALGRGQGAPAGVRIGGNSTDQAWWNPRRQPRPPGVSIDLDRRWIRSLGQGRQRLRSPLAVGLNLALNDPRNARAFMRALARERVPVAAFELGNEPDLYPRGRTFRVGRLVLRRPQHRPAGYSPREYVAEARAYADALPARAPLSGGGFATKPWVHDALPLLLNALGERLTEVTAHAYALTACNPTTPAADLRARLLDDATTRAMVRGVEPYLRLARPRGLPVRVSEFNSAVCGGVPGVSDVMAAALWAPQALFALADAGVSQVDLHTWAGSLYAPFAFGGAGAKTRVLPLYHALRLFALAAPVGSRLAPTHVDNAGQVRAWATVGPRGAVRILLANRSAHDARTVHIASASRRGGRLTVVAGAGLAARTARASATRIRPRGGRLAFRLPPASLALLVLPAQA